MSSRRYVFQAAFFITMAQWDSSLMNTVYCADWGGFFARNYVEFNEMYTYQPTDMEFVDEIVACEIAHHLFWLSKKYNVNPGNVVVSNRGDTIQFTPVDDVASLESVHTYIDLMLKDIHTLNYDSKMITLFQRAYIRSMKAYNIMIYPKELKFYTDETFSLYVQPTDLPAALLAHEFYTSGDYKRARIHSMYTAGFFVPYKRVVNPFLQVIANAVGMEDHQIACTRIKRIIRILKTMRLYVNVRYVRPVIFEYLVESYDLQKLAKHRGPACKEIEELKRITNGKDRHSIIAELTSGEVTECIRFTPRKNPKYSRR